MSTLVCSYPEEASDLRIPQKPFNKKTSMTNKTLYSVIILQYVNKKVALSKKLYNIPIKIVFLNDRIISKYKLVIDNY